MKSSKVEILTYSAAIEPESFAAALRRRLSINSRLGVHLTNESRRRIAVRIFLTCWLVYSLHFATNIVREIYPALTLGDHLSFNVSEYSGLHPDIFEIPGRGAFINNNPGASIIGAVPYTLCRPLIDRVVARIQRSRSAQPPTQPPKYDSPWPMAQEFYRISRERGYDVKFGLAAGAIQFLSMAPISALNVVVMFYVLLGLGLPTRKATLLALLYAFATPLFYRTAQLNQNLLVCHCAFFAFAMLWRPWDQPDRLRKPKYFLIGLLSGWVVVLDYSGIVVPVLIGLYALVRRTRLPSECKSKKDLWLFAAGVALCAIVLMGYQWSSFGHPLYPAQRYMPPTPLSRVGYNGMDRPHLDLFLETAFGIRYGLFLSAPFLLLALWLPGWVNRKYRLTQNLETYFIFLFSIAFFLFCSANQFGRLQFNSGVRYIVPVVPFLFLIAAGVWARLPTIPATVVALASTYWSWCLAMYRDVELGSGILDTVKQATFAGPRLPWLNTLQAMGYVSGNALLWALFLLAGLLIWTIWYSGRPRNYSNKNALNLS